MNPSTSDTIRQELARELVAIQLSLMNVERLLGALDITLQVEQSGVQAYQTQTASSDHSDGNGRTKTSPVPDGGLPDAAVID